MQRASTIAFVALSALLLGCGGGSTSGIPTEDREVKFGSVVVKGPARLSGMAE